MRKAKPISPDIIARFESQRAPRYTSYPTAPHFTDLIADANYRRLPAELPADSSLSLYLHVPFCRSMCWYCGCHTKIVSSTGPIHEYLRVLQAEIRMVAAADRSLPKHRFLRCDDRRVPHGPSPTPFIVKRRYGRMPAPTS